VYKRQAPVQQSPAAGHKLRAAAYRSRVPVSREPDLVLLVVMVHWSQLLAPRGPDLVLLVVMVHWLQLPAPKGPDLRWPVVMVKG
jgi:hypothetical protein